MTIMKTKRHVIIENEDSTKSEQSIHEDTDTEVKESSNDDEEGDTTTSNAAWADSISKILKANKPKGKKTLVLSKAKKITDVKKTKPKFAGFEVQTANGEIKQEIMEHTKDDDCDTTLEAPPPPRKKKRDLPSLRVKPNILDKDRERTLSKVATKGVVQLFNAVKMQQNDISNKLKEAGPLEVRKEKVLKSIDKRTFLDVLMGEKSQVVDDNVIKPKEDNNKATWSVLRDDFMMGAKMKDWDKEVEEESEIEETNIESE